MGRAWKQYRSTGPPLAAAQQRKFHVKVEILHWPSYVGKRTLELSPHRPVAVIGDENARLRSRLLTEGAAPCSDAVSNNQPR